MRVFVCDAHTGKPEPGAEVVIREAVERANSRWEVTVARGQASFDGLYSKALHALERRTGPSTHSQALGLGGRSLRPRAGRLAEHSVGLDLRRVPRLPDHRPSSLPPRQHRALPHHGDGPPADAASRTTPGAWQVAKEQQFEVTATDTRGEKVFSRRYTTNEFGSLNGAFRWGPKPPWECTRSGPTGLRGGAPRPARGEPVPRGGVQEAGVRGEGHARPRSRSASARR